MAALIEDGVKQFKIDPTATTEQQMQQLSVWRAQEQRLDHLANLKAENDAKKSYLSTVQAGNDMEASRIKLSIAEDERKADQLTREYLSDESATTDVSLMQFATADAPLDQKLQRINLLRDEQLAAISKMNLSATDRDTYENQINRKFDIFTNALTNEEGTTALRNQLARTTTGDQLVLLQESETLRKWAALDSSLPNISRNVSFENSIPALKDFANVAANMSGFTFGAIDPASGIWKQEKPVPSKAALPMPGDPDEAAVKAVFESMQQDAMRMNKDDLSEQEVELANARITNASAGVAQYGSVVTDPRAYSSYIKTMSSPEMGKLLSNPDQYAVHEEALLGASANVWALFEDEVTPLFQTSVKDGISYGAQVEVRGGQVIFTPQEKDAHPYKISNLNKKVAPLINQYVKYFAHAAGHQDYKRIYEEVVGPVVEPNKYKAPESPAQEFPDAEELDWAMIEGTVGE
jgi:hypothetical protein